MKRKPFSRTLATAVLLWVGLLTACFVADPSPVATLAPTAEPPPVAQVTATFTSAPPTPTPTPTATPTASATATETPTPTSTPTPSPTATATPTATPTPLRFAVIGDYGFMSQSALDVANLIKSWQVDFIITVGDNNYPDGEAATIDPNIGQYYHEFIYPYRGQYGPGADVNRFFPSLGNHDFSPTDGYQPYLDYFDLPGNGRYYDFVWGPVHFFALNNDWREPDGRHQTGAQARWLQEALAASDSPWKLVYMHVAPYSSGRHGSSPVAQWPYAEWGASIVLAGHDHTYERLEVDGLTYVVNGLGGYPARYPFTSEAPGSQLFFNEDYGAMLAEATETELRFQFITRAGVVVDTFTLTRP